MADVASIPLTLPTCVTTCILMSFGSSSCNMDNFKTCFCPNDKLQKVLMACVVETCNQTERAEGLLANHASCAGTPSQSHSGQMRAALIALAIVTLTIVFLRFISRLTIAKKIWWDDFTILIATIILIASMALMWISVENGFGLHIWKMSPNQLLHLQLQSVIFLTVQVMYTSTQVVTKISILLFYIRVFPRRWLIIASWAGIVSLIVQGIVFIFLLTLRCEPIRASWDLNTTGRCVSLNHILVGGAALSISDDLVILLLPIPELYRLTMGRQKKFLLAIMFSIGTFATITSIIRLRYVVHWDLSIDSSYDDATLSLWSLIEICIAIICACLPFLRPLLINYLPSVVDTIAHKVTPGRNTSNDTSRTARRISWQSGAGDVGVKGGDCIDGGGAEEKFKPSSHGESGCNGCETFRTRSNVSDLEAYQGICPLGSIETMADGLELRDSVAIWKDASSIRVESSGHPD